MEGEVMAVKGDGVDRVYWLLDNGIPPSSLVDAMVRWMSDSDIWNCLDANELTPRFDDEEVK
jgi:hypothetical protein